MLNELLNGAKTNSINLRSCENLRLMGKIAWRPVDPDAARHLILLIHELVTNAAKYGSLSPGNWSGIR